MNNFELRMTIWKLINPVTSNCDRRPAGQREKDFQRAVSGSNNLKFSDKNHVTKTFTFLSSCDKAALGFFYE